MVAGFSAGTPADRFSAVYRIAMIFAGVLLILPAGCCLLDSSMWFINGLAVAAYGFTMGMAIQTSRGFAAAIVCAVLGLTHPAWVMAIAPIGRSLGLMASLNSPAVTGDTMIEYALAFALTAGVFSVALAICLVSWVPVALLAAAAAVATGFLWTQQHFLAWWPFGGLWPSALSFSAGIVHMGIATSLWLGLSRPPAGALAPVK